MTPYELLAIVAVIGVARAVLSLRPVVAGSSGRSTTIAREFLDPFIIAGLAAWVLITFVARTYYIPSGSMLPTLQIHDVLLVDKFEQDLVRRRHGGGGHGSPFASVARFCGSNSALSGQVQSAPKGPRNRRGLSRDVGVRNDDRHDGVGANPFVNVRETALAIPGEST